MSENNDDSSIKDRENVEIDETKALEQNEERVEEDKEISLNEDFIQQNWCTLRMEWLGGGAIVREYPRAHDIDMDKLFDFMKDGREGFLPNKVSLSQLVDVANELWEAGEGL